MLIYMPHVKLLTAIKTVVCSVALQLNTSMHIFLTHSFGAQIQPACESLHNMQLDQSVQRLKL